MAGTVDMRVVALLGLILDMGRIDGDAAIPFFGCVVDLVIAASFVVIAAVSVVLPWSK
jgi:hypothetical protein